MRLGFYDRSTQRLRAPTTTAHRHVCSARQCPATSGAAVRRVRTVMVPAQRRRIPLLEPMGMHRRTDGTRYPCGLQGSASGRMWTVGPGAQMLRAHHAFVVSVPKVLPQFPGRPTPFDCRALPEQATPAPPGLTPGDGSPTRPVTCPATPAILSHPPRKPPHGWSEYEMGEVDDSWVMVTSPPVASGPSASSAATSPSAPLPQRIRSSFVPQAKACLLLRAQRCDSGPICLG